MIRLAALRVALAGCAGHVVTTPATTSFDGTYSGPLAVTEGVGVCHAAPRTVTVSAGRFAGFFLEAPFDVTLSAAGSFNAVSNRMEDGHAQVQLSGYVDHGRMHVSWRAKFCAIGGTLAKQT
jgi:hypothetical protein